MSDRIKGSNMHGNKNEELLVQYLDEKKFKNLNTNMKNFIVFILEDNKMKANNDLRINAYMVTNNKFKQDIIIKLNGVEYYLSIKMGTGNSVHQEKIEDFIEFLVTNFNISEKLANDFRLATWVDGTLDGSGNKESRFSISKFQAHYPKSSERIKEFMDENKGDLIKHFIVVGRHNSRVDYIYHGTIENGAWISTKQLIDYNLKYPLDVNKKTPALPIGRMSLQPWNAVLNGNPKTEHKRGQIQVKYTKMEKDFEELHIINTLNKGTYQGDKEEFNISKTLNKNKKHKFWKVMQLSENNDNLYLVKVDRKVTSVLSGKKVLPKADAYVIEANLDVDFLLGKEYSLKEKDLEGIDYKIINRTGISVKRADSKNFTIAKFTINTFEKLFEGYDKGRILSLAVFLSIKTPNDNLKIIDGAMVSKEELFAYMSQITSISKKYDLNDREDIRYIKKTLNDRIRDVIENNPKVKNAIFKGDQLYSEPYCANYIFKKGELTSDVITQYSITRGSGLSSKGIYTIIIKPKN